MFDYKLKLEGLSNKTKNYPEFNFLSFNINRKINNNVFVDVLF